MTTSFSLSRYPNLPHRRASLSVRSLPLWHWPSRFAFLPLLNRRRREKSNMELVGYNDLQARSAYQPDPKTRPALDRLHRPSWRLQPNPMTGRRKERHVRCRCHRPQAAALSGSHSRRAEKGINADSGGAQMVRVCDGSELPHADKSKFYMLRAFGTTAHEIWDVTDPAKPSRLNVVVSGLLDTHKSWWECDTGIAYLVSGVPGWRVSRMAQIYDLSDPASRFHPRFRSAGPAAWLDRPCAQRLARPHFHRAKRQPRVLRLRHNRMASSKSSIAKNC